MKKEILSLSILLLTTTSAFAGVPIFSSQESQEVTVTPSEQQNIFTQNVHTTGSTQENYYANTNTHKPYGSIQNEGYKSAISNLDSAQAEIRENLVEVKAQFAEVKEKYETTKVQYNALKKQIKASEKKIKKIEKTKKNIAKDIIDNI